MPLRDARRTEAAFTRRHFVVNAERRGTEQTRVHRPEIRRHLRAKLHLREDVAFDIDARRHFDQFEPLRADPEHGALGHIQRGLSALARKRRVVADLFELAHELLVTAFFAYDRLPRFPSDVATARRQRAAEDHALRVLADVDEATHADDLVAEAADIHVALRVDFGERKEREIEAAAVIEVELRRLFDHRGKILRAARIAARN